MNQEKIGKYISEKRKEKKITQEELAERLGVSDRAISNWENGKNMPDLSLFKPLCKELGITINDLMSGEDVDDNKYIESLEENIVDMVNELEKKKKRKIRRLIIIFILIVAFVISIPFINYYYEFDAKYDSRVMKCEIEGNDIEFAATGQSVLNMYHTCRKIDNESICFFHTTVSIYNKQRSRWEYFESMARLLEGKKVSFGSIENIKAPTSNIKVYYTDYSIKKVEKASREELENIINNSYLMCESKEIKQG